MSDDPPAGSTSESADPPAETGSEDEPTQSTPTPMSSATDRFDVARFRRLLDRGLLVAFVLLAVVATLQFYVQVGAAIETWVASEYEPVVKAAFNLALLAVAVAGVSYQLRRLGRDAPER